MKSMTVLKVSPGQLPQAIDIPHTLEDMQKLVGGFIEAIYPFEDMVAIVCNEDGKLLGQEPNRAIRDPDTGEILDIICGTFFVCGLTYDNFASLTAEQINHYSQLFRFPERFLWNGSYLVVLQMVMV